MIWEQWLTPARSTVEYTKFQHVAFAERVEQRPGIQDTLVRLVRDYHTRSHTATNLLARLGYPRTALAMTGDQRPLSPETRRAHLAEILACEYARVQLGYDLPVHRLHYNPNPDQSMKGDDILGFRFARTRQERHRVLIGEAKYRSTYTSTAVLEAHETLNRGFRPYPASIDFVATVLDLNNDQAKAELVRQIRNLLSTAPRRVICTSLLFLVTGGRPRDPFGCIENLPERVPNLVAVNITLGEDMNQWIDQIYERELAS